MLLYSSILWRLKITVSSGKRVITEEKMGMNKREALHAIKTEGKHYASLLFNALNIYASLHIYIYASLHLYASLHIFACAMASVEGTLT